LFAHAIVKGRGLPPHASSWHNERRSPRRLSDLLEAGTSAAITSSIRREAAMTYSIKVNGTQHSVDVDGDTPLLWVLRDTLGFTGTKFGCGIAQCGACTVFLDGKPLRACALPVSALGNGEITTIEAITGKEAEAVQKAWIARDVPQCGYCQSGQVMSAIALLKAIKKPTDRDIDLAMNGNICRCATYVRIRAAIHDAARTLEG
jgi:isoquinoline 1-oxidoreductase subunit alpha